MDRRKFFGMVGIGISSEFDLSNLASVFPGFLLGIDVETQEARAKTYGSGHFGEWITDSFGLPAYRYTCNQIFDPKAISPAHKEWRSPTDHTHQVGNDRLVAAVSNYGYVQVRQDEGSPKCQKDYCPERGHYGAGIEFLTDGKQMLSTYFPGNADSFGSPLG